MGESIYKLRISKGSQLKQTIDKTRNIYPYFTTEQILMYSLTHIIKKDQQNPILQKYQKNFHTQWLTNLKKENLKVMIEKHKTESLINHSLTNITQSIYKQIANKTIHITKIYNLFHDTLESLNTIDPDNPYIRESLKIPEKYFTELRHRILQHPTSLQTLIHHKVHLLDLYKQPTILEINKK